MSSEPAPDVDFGRTARDYAQWRQGFPEDFYTRLAALGVGRPGQKLLDLGTGTGLLARAFARHGCDVTGLDPSAELLAEAGRQSDDEGLQIAFTQARAENTGLDADTFDAVVAGTCWHWFDRPKAAEECRRMLKPQGRLAIAHLDWLNLPGNVIDVSVATIAEFNPAQSGRDVTFQFPGWLYEITSAGFPRWEVFGFSTKLPYSHEAWRGRIRASAGVGASMDGDTLAAFDGELQRRLREGFQEETLLVDHRIFCLVLWAA